MHQTLIRNGNILPGLDIEGVAVSSIPLWGIFPNPATIPMTAKETTLQTWRRDGVVLPPVAGAAEAFDAAMAALIKEFHAREIWLFGSCAEGKPDRHSDVDLLVVKDSDPSQKRPAAAARELVARRAGFLPCDIIVMAPQTFARRMKERSGLYSGIQRRGLRLYAR